MTARLILPADADRDEWLAARRKGITASEIAVILGISPFDSPFNLYWRKRGDLPEDYDNTAMSLGRHLEPWIADQWAADHPEFEIELGGLYASEDRPWQMATPDRVLYERVMCRSCHGGLPIDCECDERLPSLLEIKSSGTYDGWGEDGTDQIPAYYRAQVLWQLDTLGLETAHVTCFFLGTRTRRDYMVTRDDTDLELMRKAALEFLRRLEQGEPPDIDHHTATLGALKALHPDLEDDEATVPDDVAEDYRRARNALKSAQEQADLAENRLRAAMGSAQRAVDTSGEKVCTRSIYERTGLDTKRLTKDHPWVRDYQTTSTVDRLNAARSKKS